MVTDPTVRCLIRMLASRAGVVAGGAIVAQAVKTRTLSGPGHNDGSIRPAMHPAWTALLLGHKSPNLLPRRAVPAGCLATLGA